MAEPERALGSHDHRRRVDRRFFLLRLAGKQPQSRQPQGRPGRRLVGDPRWRYLPPGEIQTGPADHAGQPALVQMGSLFHLDVRHRAAVRGVLRQPDLVPAGPGQQPQRSGRCIAGPRLTAGWLVHLLLSLRFGTGQAPRPARPDPVRAVDCRRIRLQQSVQRPWCVPACGRRDRHHHGR